MNTEITDRIAEKPTGAWLLYDGECGFCTRLASRFCPRLRAYGMDCAPLQEPWVGPVLNLPETELFQEMRLLKGDGSFVSGATAVVELSRFFWWARPIRWIAKLPGGSRLLNRGYTWVARNRGCTHDACGVRSRSNALGLLLIPVVLAFIFILSASPIPNWGVMWGIAAAIWLWLKAVTVLHVRSLGLKLRPILLLRYLLAWPGTDAVSFFTPNPKLSKPTASEWFFGALNTFTGVALLSVAPQVAYPLLSGWIAMIGIAFILHFGIFKLLSVFWRAIGIDAPPLMDLPLAARNLGEFWGRRWNTGFSIPARRHILEPLGGKIGPALALMLVFLASGIVHELAISVPARGGYGLPTLYFLFQAAAILFERSAVGKHLGLGSGIRGRIFALVCAAGPPFWLFHPPFVEHVINPFVAALHSMKGALL